MFVLSCNSLTVYTCKSSAYFLNNYIISAIFCLFHRIKMGQEKTGRFVGFEDYLPVHFVKLLAFCACLSKCNSKVMYKKTLLV